MTTNKHPLLELRDIILDSDSPGELLTIADGYLSSIRKMGDHFVLPRKHAALLPILEYYAGDLGGWLKYVKNIRDSFERRSDAWREVYTVYRTLVIRYAQQSRRERISAAVDMAIQKGLIENTPDAKQRYARRCKQAWSKARDALLDEHRRKTKHGRLSQDEQSEITLQFWSDVEELIALGEVPEP